MVRILQDWLEVHHPRGDTVLLQPADPGAPLYIAEIISMYSGPSGAKAHIIWYGRAAETVLGEGADSRELYQLTECEDLSLLSIIRKCEVKIKPSPDQAEWRLQGSDQDSRL